MALDETLKKLSPAERVKRLKELEAQKKREIEEAEQLLKQAISEQGLEEEEKKQLPVPQMKAESAETLETIEAKLLWAAKRGVSLPTKKTEEEHHALEESVQTEQGGNLGRTPHYGDTLNAAISDQKGITYQTNEKKRDYMSGEQQKFYEQHEEHHHEEYHSRSALPGHERETQDFYSRSHKKKTS